PRSSQKSGQAQKSRTSARQHTQSRDRNRGARRHCHKTPRRTAQRQRYTRRSGTVVRAGTAGHHDSRARGKDGDQAELPLPRAPWTGTGREAVQAGTRLAPQRLTASQIALPIGLLADRIKDHSHIKRARRLPRPLYARARAQDLTPLGAVTVLMSRLSPPRPRGIVASWASWSSPNGLTIE